MNPETQSANNISKGSAGSSPKNMIESTSDSEVSNYSGSEGDNRGTGEERDGEPIDFGQDFDDTYLRIMVQANPWTQEDYESRACKFDIMLITTANNI